MEKKAPFKIFRKEGQVKKNKRKMKLHNDNEC